MTPYLHRERTHQPDADSKVGEYYTPDLANAIYEKYRLDFETFGYERALPIAR